MFTILYFRHAPQAPGTIQERWSDDNIFKILWHRDRHYVLFISHILESRELYRWVIWSQVVAFKPLSCRQILDLDIWCNPWSRHLNHKLVTAHITGDVFQVARDKIGLGPNVTLVLYEEVHPGRTDELTPTKLLREVHCRTKCYQFTFCLKETRPYVLSLSAVFSLNKSFQMDEVFDGDIWVIQRSDLSGKFVHNNVDAYFKDLNNRVEVTFCDKNVVSDVGFTVVLNQKMSYNEVRHLSIGRRPSIYLCFDISTLVKYLPFLTFFWSLTISVPGIWSSSRLSWDRTTSPPIL